MIKKLTGHSFRPTMNPGIKTGTEVVLSHDKGNQFSARAIGVYFGDILLGYVPEANNEDHEKIFDKLPIKAKVVSISTLQPGEEFGKFSPGEITHMEFEFDMSCDKKGILSFNENLEINFLEDEHRYVYNGENLTSATTYIKKWMKGFDAEQIAPAYANKFGFKAKDVIDYWKGNGNVSSTFGTAIHNALEHYEKYKEMGALIQEHKELEFNPALPSHPALRQIVLDFYKQKLREGVVHTEVLVSNVEKGICGLVDRLLVTSSGKTCRVEDYKVNIGSETIDPYAKYLGQFAELPKNKLSKYQLQLSVYARLLELSGWKVEGLTVYVFENEWKQFDLDVLKLDF